MKNILVVDESKAVHAFVGISLSNFEVRLTHVFNGQKALAAIEAGTDFDLVILDCEMPSSGGSLVIDALGAKKPTAVISMTTKNTPKDISDMLKKGVREYLIKPFTSEILIERIESALELELAHAV